MISMDKKRNINEMSILAFLIVARLACPALTNIPLMNMTFVFIYGVLFCFLHVVFDNRMTKQDFVLFVSVSLYVTYIITRLLIAGQGIFSKDAFNAYMLFFLINILLWSKNQTAELRSNLFKLILFTCAFNFLYSIWILILDPDASRRAAATSVLEASPHDVLNAVGSFDAVYGAIFVILLAIYMRKNMQKGRERIIVTLIMIIMALVFIVMAAYATAILILLLALIICLNNKKSLIFGIGTVIILVILIFHEFIGNAIMALADSVNYSKILSLRVKEFGYMLKTFEATGTYAGEEGRWQKLIDSFTTFTMHPIFGGLGIRGSKIGGHSEIFDILGKYGLFGFVLLVIVFVNLYKSLTDNLTDEKSVKCLKIMFFIYIVLSVLNPSLYALLIMPIVLMFPLSKDYMEQAKNRDKAKN